eukprot:TRINITY_DN14509_c0_g1_i1.p1 TRINITY_DN14509_c0_g1~~TRINITY_DN14509_c0_g1_i1.p1  ORF type:complete len:337 (-),score=35.22 TRINITY_DN14509_c0_g1_i1:27-1037(-)
MFEGLMESFEHEKNRTFCWHFTRFLFKLGLYAKWVGEMLIRMVGPLFVLFAWTMLSCVVYVFWNGILQYHTPLWTPYGFFHIAIDLFLIQGVFFNYFMCVFTPPGSPPEPQTEEEIKTINDLEHEKTPERGKGFSKYCKPCRTIKPRRAHHCHVCGRCVLKMDHHCPWISNCVGHNNHRYFFLFLFYMFTGAIYAAIMTIGPFRDSSYFNNMTFLGVSGKATIIFLFVMSVALLIAVSFMFFWHLYLVATSQTTIEFYFNKFKAAEARMRGEPDFVNPYDLGLRKNWEFFFGKGRNIYLSWMAPSWSAPPGDGVTYPMNTSELPTTTPNRRRVNVN